MLLTTELLCLICETLSPVVINVLPDGILCPRWEIGPYRDLNRRALLDWPACKSFLFESLGRYISTKTKRRPYFKTKPNTLLPFCGVSTLGYHALMSGHNDDPKKLCFILPAIM
ncbi:hypothetical protein BgiBS90_023924 [Biomphalaria glabrata]|nr:hypothetical protein BgiBS90_023924 [Biomphalaria glabrata]